MTSQIIFLYLAIVIIVSSILVITRRNPVHSILWMLLLFFHIAAMYIFLNAEFLAVIQIIIYAGAILVLFLFIVMLLNLKREERERKAHSIWPAAIILGLAIAAQFITIMSTVVFSAPQDRYSTSFIQKEGASQVLGSLLYTEFLFPFEVASLILLVGIIGAIVIAKKRMG